MKRILITGVTGFVGNNVLFYLLEKTDWEFTVLCSWKHKGSPALLKPNPRVEVITHDITQPIPEIGNFDYILNFASESHVDRSIADPVNFIENNVSSVLQMLEYARQHKPEKFIHFSTDEVYGPYEHKEWDVLMPTNPYSASKAAQEMICIAYWNTYKLPIVITNSNNIIGPNQNKEKYVPKIIEMIKTNQEITIHHRNNEFPRRFYNPVDNIADALLFILNQPYPTNLTKPVRYAISGGEELNTLEIAQLIAKLIGKPLKYKLVDVDTVRPGNDQFYPATEGLLTEIGWKPVVTLEEGLKKIIDL